MGRGPQGSGRDRCLPHEATHGSHLLHYTAGLTLIPVMPQEMASSTQQVPPGRVSPRQGPPQPGSPPGRAPPGRASKAGFPPGRVSLRQGPLRCGPPGRVRKLREVGGCTHKWERTPVAPAALSVTGSPRKGSRCTEALGPQGQDATPDHGLLSAPQGCGPQSPDTRPPSPHLLPGCG